MTSLFKDLVIVRKLGSGGFGTVYKCQHKAGNTLAMKVINNNATGLTSLLEASIMSTLRHPSINPALEVSFIDNNLCILQLLAQCDLYHWRKDNIPTQHQLMKWTFDLIQAVDVIHQCRLIHGDIKSLNILVFDSNTIRLSDFSLISLVEAKQKTTINFGTPNYRPPEIWKSLPRTQAIDIWGLGCVIYEIVFGKHPFKFISSMDLSDITSLLKKIKRYSVNLFNNIPSHWVNHPIIDIITQCLKYNPGDRPTSYNLLKHAYFRELTPTPWSYLLPNKSIELDISSHLFLENDFPPDLLDLFRKSQQIQQILTEIHKLMCSVDIGDVSSGSLSIWLTSKLLNWYFVINHEWYLSRHPKFITIERSICDRFNYRLIGSYLSTIKNNL